MAACQLCTGKKQRYDTPAIPCRNLRFELHYSPEGIIVNDERLKGALDVKYRRLFKDVLGPDLANASTSGRMTSGDLKKYFFDKNASLPENEFAAISRILFNEGKIEYIIADAVADGILKEGERFKVIHKYEVVTFEGKTIAAERQTICM